MPRSHAAAGVSTGLLTATGHVPSSTPPTEMNAVLLTGTQQMPRPAATAGVVVIALVGAGLVARQYRRSSGHTRFDTLLLQATGLVSRCTASTPVLLTPTGQTSHVKGMYAMLLITTGQTLRYLRSTGVDAVPLVATGHVLRLSASTGTGAVFLISTGQTLASSTSTGNGAVHCWPQGRQPRSRGCTRCC
jgi:hypothetical protein